MSKSNLRESEEGEQANMNNIQICELRGFWNQKTEIQNDDSPLTNYIS